MVDRLFREDFYQLEQRSSAFSAWLDANNSPAELMAALAPALRRRPWPTRQSAMCCVVCWGVNAFPARD